MLRVRIVLQLMIFNIHTFAWILYNYIQTLDVSVLSSFNASSNFLRMKNLKFYTVLFHCNFYSIILYYILFNYNSIPLPRRFFHFKCCLQEYCNQPARQSSIFIDAYESINISNRSPISSILVREPIENFQRPFELNFFRTDDIQKARSIQAIVSRQ